MGRTKKTPFKGWESAAAGGIEKRYVRLGNTQLLHTATTSLNNLSFRIYIYMRLESGGSMEFTFSRSKYKRFCSSGGFQKAVAELCEKGFIEVVQHNKNLRTANVYRFSDQWKNYIDSN